jgi:hypothetical protein
MNMGLLVDGVAACCTEEQFNEYHQEVELVAHQLVEDFSEGLF